MTNFFNVCLSLALWSWVFHWHNLCSSISSVCYRYLAIHHSAFNVISYMLLMWQRLRSPGMSRRMVRGRLLYGCRRSSSQAAERDGRLHCPWVHSSVPASASTASVCLWSRWCPIIGLPLPDKSYPADNLPVKIRPARQPTGRGGFLLASYRPGRDFWGTII